MQQVSSQLPSLLSVFRDKADAQVRLLGKYLVSGYMHCLLCAFNS